MQKPCCEAQAAHLRRRCSAQGALVLSVKAAHAYRADGANFFVVAGPNRSNLQEVSEVLNTYRRP